MMDDDDDDGNFTKWMSSYWGHGGESGHSKERKRSFRRPARAQADRRGSLPTVSQLDAMKLNRIHAATMAAAPSHIKTREEKGEVRPHQRARRSSSDDNSRPKSAIPENRITTIPELAESFEKRLYLRDKKAVDDKLCLICHEDMRKNGGTVQELHCTHRFHKEHVRYHPSLHEGSSFLDMHDVKWRLGGQSSVGPAAAAKRPIVRRGDPRVGGGCLQMDPSPWRRSSTHSVVNSPCGDIADIILRKDCMEQWLWKKQTCPTCRIHVSMPKPLYWSSSRIQVP
ncbi:leukemia NUP98 fusion partner 1 [Scomber scombrus]|uniref:leukemia NUP98 fusion partner 1 n=1 Tax=Scomber scombrus TaxID=13677 RepID=UPI002DDC8D86|nr:leukemia NUP98 fusion partner 1 [Scomber scombrus]